MWTGHVAGMEGKECEQHWFDIVLEAWTK